jgi:hypothetical protein
VFAKVTKILHLKKEVEIDLQQYSVKKKGKVGKYRVQTAKSHTV